MEGSKKVILHIIHDSIWFDKVYLSFEGMDGYINRYLYRDIGIDKSSFEYINYSEKVICAQSLQEWGKIVSDPNNDIIYFQGLWKSSLKAIDYISDNAIVMWWCLGMEIYSNLYGWAPLLPVRLYKPKTFSFMLTHSKSLRLFLSKILTWKFPLIYDGIQSIRYRISGRRILHKELLSRIDYAFTPLPIELEELKYRHSYIKAKQFELRGKSTQWPFNYQEKVGHILFDHSAMSNNNHLDLLAALRKCHLSDRHIFFPLSYGNKDIKDYLMKHASFEGAETHFLTEVMPRQEYTDLLSNCSHALFGTIRQSGLGNTFILLRKGVKLFFFEESIVYKYCKREGYHVFSIEKDLNDESIVTPLPYDMALHNYNLFYKRRGVSDETYQQQFDRILSSHE